MEHEGYFVVRRGQHWPAPWRACARNLSPGWESWRTLARRMARCCDRPCRVPLPLLPLAPFRSSVTRCAVFDELIQISPSHCPVLKVPAVYHDPAADLLMVHMQPSALSDAKQACHPCLSAQTLLVPLFCLLASCIRDAVRQCTQFLSIHFPRFLG